MALGYYDLRSVWPWVIMALVHYGLPHTNMALCQYGPRMIWPHFLNLGLYFKTLQANGMKLCPGYRYFLRQHHSVYTEYSAGNSNTLTYSEHWTSESGQSHGLRHVCGLVIYAS